MTHVFVAVAGSPTRLTALCGLQIELGSVGLFDGMAGLPCVHCLVVASARRQCTPSSPNHT